MKLPLINLCRKKSLIFNFAWLNIKIRHRGSYLGFFWIVLEPLLFFIIIYTIFTSIKIATGEDFAIYLLIGVILYHSFSRGTISGLNSLRQNRNIIASLNIRKELFPVVATTITLLLLFAEMGVFFGLMPVFEFTPTWSIILIPLVIILLLGLILGLSYFLSIISIYAKDIVPLWTVFVNALFFLTPIFWRLENVEGIALEIQKINPIGMIIELAHKLVFGTIPPLSDWLVTTSIVLGILVVGYVIFQKYEKYALEKI